MPYNEIKSSLERAAEKRKRYQEMLSQAATVDPTQMVSGRAVPYSPIQGLSKIAQALLAKQGISAADAKETELNQQMEQERQTAFQGLSDTFEGRPEVYDAADMTTPGRESGMDANPVKAAMMAMQDPYLQESGIGQSLMKGMSGGKSGGGTPYSVITQVTRPDKTTVPVVFDTRTKQISNLDGSPYTGGGEITGTTPQFDAPVNQMLAGAKEQGKSDVELAMKPQISAATKLAERDAEKIIERTKVESTLSSQDSKTEMLGGLFTQAKDQTSGWSTGIMNAATGWIPGSPSNSLNSTLSTIKANVGFDRLQEMRDNSKSGGALGSVSEFENKTLQAVWGDLEASTSKEQFSKNLERVEKQVEESWKRVKEAYKKDYGVEYGSSKDPETEKQPQVMKFDAQGNLVQ